MALLHNPTSTNQPQTTDQPTNQPHQSTPPPPSGGWPFSTAAHGWPIADCTAEGLKGVLALMDEACIVEGGVPLIPDERWVGKSFGVGVVCCGICMHAHAMHACTAVVFHFPFPLRVPRIPTQNQYHHTQHDQTTRLYEAIHILLSYQNGDGGWATYENNRGYGWYEWLNPSEVR